MEIEIVVEPAFSRRVTRAALRSIALRALRLERAPARTNVAIAIVGDRTIRRLNARFHGQDAATDVLSFPSGNRDSLGNIVISYETARENARAARWRTSEELELLVVHGVLHLLGYDDQTAEERGRMWKRQEQILRKRLKEY